MANIRQTILVRTDLGFSTGLLAAQVAHIHMERLRRGILGILDDVIFNTPDLREWLNTPYIFVHGVPNKEILFYYLDKAKEKEQILNPSIWYDTVYVGVSDNQKIPLENVIVGASLGPADSDIIKAVIGDLPLLS